MIFATVKKLADSAGKHVTSHPQSPTPVMKSMFVVSAIYSAVSQQSVLPVKSSETRPASTRLSSSSLRSWMCTTYCWAKASKSETRALLASCAVETPMASRRALGFRLCILNLKKSACFAATMLGTRLDADVLWARSWSKHHEETRARRTTKWMANTP